MNKKSALKGFGLAVGCLALSSLLAWDNGLSPENMTAPAPSADLLAFQNANKGASSCEQTAWISSQGNLLIDLQDGLTPEQIRSWQERYGLNLQYNSPYARDNSLMVATVDGEQLEPLIARLNGDELVESAEPNYVVSLTQEEMNAAAAAASESQPMARQTYPNDPLFKHQWHMQMVKAPFAWKFSQGRGAVVAVIDTGVAWKKANGFVACEDLAKTKIVPGYDFVNRNKLALDDNAHGTHVAGTIAQSTNNGVGVCGMAPQAAIMPIKVLSGAGSGRVSDIADGIRFAADHGANVINMSLGGPMPAKAMAHAVAYAQRQGVLVCCAAGNEHRSNVGYPAGYEESFVVSALDAKGELAWYSNYGQRVDIAAPGGDTRSDANGDGVVDGVYQNTIKMRHPEEQGYYAFQGTSMATPHVAGAAAVLVGQGVNSPKALKKILRSTAQSKSWNSKGKVIGAGALDIGKAVFKVGCVYNAVRLFLALALALALGAFSRKRCICEKAAVVPGLVLGASGLFFLPYLFSAEGMFSWLAMPMPVWDVFFLGANAHGNLLVCSCLIPALLSMAVAKQRFLRSLLAGITLGWGVYLLSELVTGATLLHLIPTGLGWLWWLANGLFCVCLSQVLLDKTGE
ncbi:MAG: S8 family serine peptidase [bacterium]|nr:S8 family serine peptidase [bacterium]